MSKRDLYIKAVSGVAIFIGAKPLKTNQTTVYRTGDDGDTQRGRDVNFFTLPNNNPFGNTDRFTDLHGGQDYNDDIVLDWSTYDGNEVLMIGKNLSPNQNWNNNVDWALGLFLGGFSDWEMINIKELMYLVAITGNYYNSLNYAPFDIADSVTVHTSTTNPSDTSRCVYRNLNSNIVGTGLDGLKTAIARTLAVRYATVNIDGGGNVSFT